jgi:hypothetical protein
MNIDNYDIRPLQVNETLRQREVEISPQQADELLPLTRAERRRRWRAMVKAEKRASRDR